MPGNSFGQSLTLESWGESHGSAIGGVVDGIPPGIALNLSQIQFLLHKRRPGTSEFVSPRNEPDELVILSGMFKGKTLGTPLAFLIENKNHKSEDYKPFKEVFRPGHADYSYYKKYNHVDYRGGGRASARETAIRVVAGGIAQQILDHILESPVRIQGGVIQMGEKKTKGPLVWESVSHNSFFCPDPTVIDEWTTYLKKIKEEGNSVGALIEIHAHGIPAGLGEPVYDKLDADLAKALMSINAVKAVEIGEGFNTVSAVTGYDELTLEQNQITFSTNKSGGILGGISTGQPIICRIALKPTSSTPRIRETVTHNLQPTSLSITGRHDPCVGIRAVPIAEAMIAFTLADHLLRWRGQCGSIPR